MSKILIMFRMISLIVMPMLEDWVRNASKIITQAVKDALGGLTKLLSVAIKTCCLDHLGSMLGQRATHNQLVKVTDS